MTLPLYVSCRTKRAAKIAFMQDAPGDCTTLHFEGGHPSIEVSREWVMKRGAQPGGYYIVYEDGYTSWEPAAAFETSSVPADQWGIPRSQDPKYGINFRGRLFNRSNGKEVPPHMPVVTFIGQDRKAMAMLTYYRSLLEKASAQSSIDERILAFSNYAVQYSETMKEPDGREPAPPMPHSINPARPATDSPSGE